MEFKKIIAAFTMINNANTMITIGSQKIQNETVRALTAENSLHNADTTLAISIVAERERAVSVETNLAVSIVAERERANSIETSLTINALLIKIDSSNAIRQTNDKLSETANHVSTAMALNKIDNSNTLLQMTNTMIISQSTANAIQFQIKLENSIALLAMKNSSDISLSQMTSVMINSQSAASFIQEKIKSDANIALVVAKNTSDVSLSQIKFENSFAMVTYKSTFDTTLSQIKMESSIAVAQINTSLVQSKNEASSAQYQLASSLKIDMSILNNSIIAGDTKFGFLLAPCPNNSYGLGVSTGCTCKAGFSGNVLPTILSPFFNSTCSAALCPMNSTGISIASGCSCASDARLNAVIATTVAPFYNVELYACPFLVDFKKSGGFAWTSFFTGTLSVIVVAGGGAGGMYHDI